MPEEGPYQITLTVKGVADENVAWTARALWWLTGILKLDGTSIEFDLSVERNHDGVERVYEYVDAILPT